MYRSETLPLALGKDYMPDNKKREVDQLQTAECLPAPILKALVALSFGLQAQLP